MVKRINVLGPYSLHRSAGDLMFLSGQLGLNPDTGELEEGFKKQCVQSLANIQLILESEGLSLEDVIKLTVLMDDLEDFDMVNEVFEEFFDAPYPSRSTFEVARLPKDALIEIEAIAMKKTAE